MPFPLHLSLYGGAERAKVSLRDLTGSSLEQYLTVDLSPPMMQISWIVPFPPSRGTACLLTHEPSRTAAIRRAHRQYTWLEEKQCIKQKAHYCSTSSQLTICSKNVPIKVWKCFLNGQNIPFLKCFRSFFLVVNVEETCHSSHIMGMFLMNVLWTLWN